RDADAGHDTPGEVATEVVGAEHMTVRERRLQRREEILLQIEMVEARYEDDHGTHGADDEKDERDDRAGKRESVGAQERERVSPAARLHNKFERFDGRDAHAAPTSRTLGWRSVDRDPRAG